MGWCIFTDLSGVTEVTDGHHTSEQNALEALVYHLESNKSDTADKLAKAKRRLRKLRKT